MKWVNVIVLLLIMPVYSFSAFCLQTYVFVVEHGVPVPRMPTNVVEPAMAAPPPVSVQGMARSNAVPQDLHGDPVRAAFEWLGKQKKEAAKRANVLFQVPRAKSKNEAHCKVNVLALQWQNNMRMTAENVLAQEVCVSNRKAKSIDSQKDNHHEQVAEQVALFWSDIIQRIYNDFGPIASEMTLQPLSCETCTCFFLFVCLLLFVGLLVLL